MTDKKPICVKCELSMTCEENGVTVQYTGNTAQRGDLYKCRKCGNQIIIGFGAPYTYLEKCDYSRGL